MPECPYCGADATADARYCDRCGERLRFEDDDREGLFRRSSIQYLQGVRHGARPLDPDTDYHQHLQADLRTAVADLSYLAGINDLNLATVLDVDATTLQSADLARSPDTDLDPATRRAMGVATLVVLLSDAYDGPTLDELRVADPGDED